MKFCFFVCYDGLQDSTDQSLAKEYFEGIPSFQWTELRDKDEIGQGSFGFALKACFVPENRTVVVKRFFGEGESHFKNVSKEAKMLKRVSHPKIA